MSVVYLTWDGPGCEYLESLFFPILSRLDEDVSVLELSYGTDDEAHRTADAAHLKGIDYVRVPIPPISSSSLRAAVGIVSGLPFLPMHLRRRRADVLVVRNVMSGFIALSTRRLLGNVAMVFDSDGFLPDERVDFLGWSASGWPYRVLRDVESEVVRRSQVVIARTDRGRDILRARGGAGVSDDAFDVIPNGKDPFEFRPGSPDERHRIRSRLGFGADDQVLVYCGSLGPQYLPNELMDLYVRVRTIEPKARLLILSPSLERANELVRSRSDVKSRDIVIRRLPPSEVATALRAADVGIALREPSFSQRGVSPIKLAEYLLTGLPTVCNDGVGDVGSQFADRGSVLVLADVTVDELARGARWILTAVQDQTLQNEARALGLDIYSIDAAARRYQKAINTARSRRASRNGTGAAR